MQIRFHCPTDRCVAIIEFEPLEDCNGAIRCPRCGVEHRISPSDVLRQSNTVDRCTVCGGSELFLRKDFPQRLGLAVVLICGLASIWFFRTNIVVSWSILAAAVLVDLVVYALVGRVTTCYVCRAEYRKCFPNPTHASFDLATSDKY